MPTAIDVFEKVRGHERAEQLKAARDADLLPYFRKLESPAAPVVVVARVVTPCMSESETPASGVRSAAVSALPSQSSWTKPATCP